MAVVLKLFLHARLIVDYLPVLAVKCIITFCWSKLKFGQCLSKTLLMWRILLYRLFMCLYRRYFVTWKSLHITELDLLLLQDSSPRQKGR